MTVRHVSRALMAAVVMCGLFAFAPAKARGQETIMLPEQGGPITLVGCFQRLRVTESDDPGMKFVLSRPTVGPATSVPEAACSFTNKEPMVELDDIHTNVHKHHLDQSQVGKWIEVTGRLEKKGSQLLREVHVESYREVPVVVPTARAPEPTPEPPAIASPPPVVPAAPTPLATTGVEPEPQLPKTGSVMPMTGLFGFLALAIGLALHLAQRRTR